MYNLLSPKNSSEEQFKPKRKNKLFLVVLLSCFFIVLFFLGTKVFSAELTSESTVISDSRPSTTNVNYNFNWSGSTPGTLRCVLIQTCTTRTGVGACTVPTGINTTGATKGTFTGLTSGSWSLDASTNGDLKLTNAAGESPGANISLAFSGIQNPSSAWTYYSRIYTYSDVSCTTLVDSGWSSFNINSGVVVSATILSPPPPTANIVFVGKSSPLAMITILMNGSVVSTFQAGNDGNFSRTITAITPGTYTFAIFGDDRSGTRTTISYYTLTLLSGTTTTVSGIFLSPTISLSPTRVYKGNNVLLSGEGYPGSLVNIYLSPGNILKQTSVNANGFWSYSLDTTFLGLGAHTVFAMEISPYGEHSANTAVKSFTVISKPSTPSTTPTSQPPDQGIVQPPVEGLLIYSSSHPDQKNWYNTNTVVLNWSKEVGVTDFSYTLDENPYTIPDDISEGSNNSITYRGLEDGIWYFHLKAKKNGSWWKVAHFLIKIDTTNPTDFSLSIKPSFHLPFFKTLFTLREKPLAVFFASDETSGVEHYEIKYDDITWWRSNKKQGEFREAESPFQMPHLAMGKYLITVRAYDAAGNFEDKTQVVIVISIWVIIITLLLIGGIIGGIIWWRRSKKEIPTESTGFSSGFSQTT